jgi:uncharacterized membrane protein
MDYTVLKWLHILSSTVLFGTGLGSAYYMFFVSLTGDARAAAAVMRYVVRADWWFTTPTIIFQPLSGFYLAQLAGYPLTTAWIAYSVALYLLALACWLPVVWIQVRMRDLACQAALEARALPARYRYFLRWWIALGTVAFFAFVAVFYLMVAKPA